MTLNAPADLKLLRNCPPADYADPIKIRPLLKIRYDADMALSNQFLMTAANIKQADAAAIQAGIPLELLSPKSSRRIHCQPCGWGFENCTRLISNPL